MRIGGIEMDYCSFFAFLGVNTPDQCFEEIYKSAREEYEDSGVFFLSDEYIIKVNSLYNSLSNCVNDLLVAAKNIKENKELSVFALFVYRAMMNRTLFKSHLAEFNFPNGSGVEYDFLPLLILVPTIEELSIKLKKRQIPEDIIGDTLKQYEDCVFLYKEREGIWGLSRGHFNHLQHYIDQKFLNVGRLRFMVVDNFAVPIKAYKNAENKIVILFDNAQINQMGLLKGTPPIEQEEECFLADIQETDEYFEGYKADEEGLFSAQKVRLLKSEWELMLQRGHSVLSVHIPPNGALTEEICDASYKRAKEVFEKYYPEFDFKCFYCHSWLLDSQLKNFLKEESNILRFQKKYCLFPGITEGRDVFTFVFKSQGVPIKDLPEQTSLQRAIKSHYLNGKYIYAMDGVFCI